MAKGISIHIGVTAVDESKFGELGTLDGCDNDAKAMANIAKDQGFQGLDPVTRQMVDTPLVLLDRDARKEVILGLMQAASELLDPGDIFLMTYSGHGAQVKNEDLSDVSDGRNGGDGEDEFLCPYDEALLDDELRVMWEKFKSNVRIVFVTDCCHCGTVADLGGSSGGTATASTAAAVRASGSEGGGTAVLALPEENMKTKPNGKGLSKSQVKRVIKGQRDLFIRKKERPGQINALVMSLAACADDETTPDGLPHGAFTTQLLEIWNRGPFDGTHEELLAEIRSVFQPGQHPEFGIEGPKGGARNSFEAQKAFHVEPVPAGKNDGT